MWVVRKSQELGLPSHFLFRKHFSINGRMQNSARRTLASSCLLFYTDEKNHYWYFNISLGTYFSSTVIHNREINIQVCNFNHTCDKKIYSSEEIKWYAGVDSGETCGEQEIEGWVGLASIWAFLLWFLHFTLLLSTLDVRKATCLKEASTIKQPPSEQFNLRNFQLQI